MSRSRKHTPITGHTTARSEKQDKRIHNRRFRRTIKLALHDILNDLDKMLPELKEIWEEWDMDKDGKAYWDKEIIEQNPKMMRK